MLLDLPLVLGCQVGAVGSLPHLDVVKHLPEDGALFPPVVLGPVLVAIRRQPLQALAQTLAVLVLVILTHTHTHVLKSNQVPKYLRNDPVVCFCPDRYLPCLYLCLDRKSVG